MIRIGKKKYNRIGKQENNEENKDGANIMYFVNRGGNLTTSTT